MEHSFLAFPDFHAAIQEITREEAECLYASRTQTTVVKAAEKKLLAIIRTTFKSLKSVLDNNSWFIVEHVFTEMPHNEALSDLFDRCSERYRKSSMLINVFSRLALASSRFPLPKAKLICENLKKQFKVIYRGENSLDFPIVIL